MKTDTTKDQPAVDSGALLGMLGEHGFIFLDERPWPFLVRQEDDGEWWLYYWGESRKTFATMRRLSLVEVAKFREHALPTEQAALYLPNAEVTDAKHSVD